MSNSAKELPLASIDTHFHQHAHAVNRGQFHHGAEVVFSEGMTGDQAYAFYKKEIYALGDIVSNHLVGQISWPVKLEDYIFTSSDKRKDAYKMFSHSLYGHSRRVFDDYEEIVYHELTPDLVRLASKRLKNIVDHLHKNFNWRPMSMSNDSPSSYILSGLNTAIQMNTALTEIAATVSNTPEQAVDVVKNSRGILTSLASEHLDDFITLRSIFMKDENNLHFFRPETLVSTIGSEGKVQKLSLDQRLLKKHKDKLGRIPKSDPTLGCLALPKLNGSSPFLKVFDKIVNLAPQLFYRDPIFATSSSAATQPAVL